MAQTSVDQRWDLPLTENISFSSWELPSISNKPIYNHFTNAHGVVNYGTLRLEGDVSDHMMNWPILEFNGYIPVVHEPTYMDMGAYIYFNPAPIFIPAPSGVAIALAGLCMLTRRKR